MTCWQKNEKLEARARASESGKIKDRMERAKLESELHDMQRLVDRIPPDILAETETAAAAVWKGKVIL